MGLPQFITDNKEQIASEWVAFADGHIPATRLMDKEEIRDHIRGMLTFIAADIEKRQTDKEQKEKSKGTKDNTHKKKLSAEIHGEERVDAGFSVTDLSSEFRALRASVIRLWEAEHKGNIGDEDIQELTRFNEAIDEIWLASLVQYSKKIDESKNWFIGVLGHDLRNPLASVYGAITVLSRSAQLDEDNREILKQAESGLTKMEKLIDNLLELTRLNLGSGLNLVCKRTDFGALCQNIVEETLMANPGAEINLQTKGPLTGFWDELRISQVISNLLTNAIKHGVGPVTTTATGHTNHITLTVFNKGPKISPEIYEKVFRDLTKRSSGHSAENLGLGLYIVKEIVSAHHGKIKLQSTDEGTTFTVGLPKR